MTDTPKESFDKTTAAPKGAVYLEVPTSQFLTGAAMFMCRKPTGHEILTRAVMLTIQPDNILCMEATDGVMCMRSCVPFTDVTSGFPQQCVLDMDTLYRISQMRKESVYLVYDRGDLYLDFFGGRVFVKQFNVKPEDIRYKEVTPAKVDSATALIHAVTGPLAASFEIDPDRLMEALSSASVYLPSCTIPDLAFLNMTPEAIYMANGSSVFKMVGPFAKMKVRKGDLDMLTAAIQSNSEQVVRVCMSRDRISFATSTYAMQLPYFDFPFSDSYIVMATPATTGYYLQFDTLTTIVALMERGESTAITFRSSGRELVLESFSRDGKRSHMTLARSATDVAYFAVSVSTKATAASLRALRGAETVRVGCTGPNIVTNTEMSTLVLFGKNVQ